jgi:hypothetical protein
MCNQALGIWIGKQLADNSFMKVLDLQCRYQHAFEGWFASEDDFQSQLSRNLIECPLCSDKTITKMLSAPRLNFGATQPIAPSALPSSISQASSSVGAGVEVRVDSNSGALTASSGVAPEPNPALQASWLQMVRHVVANTEDVGNKFAEEARKIHYGESEERAIRGHASRQETAELLDEGISVLPLLIPAGLNEPLQ